MDLMCNEKEMFKDHHQVDNHIQHMMQIEPQVNTASADPTFLSERCLENLLKSEETHPNLNFYNHPQCQITPKMRTIVAEWMMEVSAPDLLHSFYKFAYFISVFSLFLKSHIMQSCLEFLRLISNVYEKTKTKISVRLWVARSLSTLFHLFSVHILANSIWNV